MAQINFGYIVVRQFRGDYIVNTARNVYPKRVNYATSTGFEITPEKPTNELKSYEEVWYVAYTIYPDTGKVHSFSKIESESEKLALIEAIDVVCNPKS